MPQTFTASEVRATIERLDDVAMTDAEAMLLAFADRLEADGKAVPVATVRRSPTGGYWIDWYGKQMPDYLGCNLFTHPAPHKGATHCDNCGCTWLDDGNNPIGCPYCKPVPADAERSAEALDGFINTGNPHWDKAAFQSRKEGNRPGSGAWMRRIRELLAAHSAQAQPPAASVTDAMVERAQDCLHDKGKDIGYYHMRASLEAVLAAQENPNG